MKKTLADKNSPPTLYREDKNHVYSQIRLSDSAYADAIRALPVVCADVVIINREKGLMYLTPRKSLPAQGWWFIGGRVLVGEPGLDAIQRCFKRETGLSLPARRFEFITMNRYLFANRQQEPQDVGCDSVCYTFAVELSDREISQIKLDRNEYEAGASLRAFTWSSLKRTPGIRPQFRALYRKIFLK